MRDDGGVKQPDDPDTGGGVLASLPTTRPQRRSPKRAPRSTAAPPSAAGQPAPTASSEAAAKAKAQAKVRSKPTSRPVPEGRPGRAAAPAATTRATSRRGSPPQPVRARRAPGGGRTPNPTVGRSAPRDPGPVAAAQGFEAGTAPGSVEPPSRADLVGSVVQGAGEIVHVGLDVGRHILRSVLGRLPG